MKKLIFVLIALSALNSCTTDNLHQIWLGIDELSSSGATCSGAILDFEDKSICVHGNLSRNNFKKANYTLTGNKITIEGEKEGEIIYLSKRLLKLRIEKDTLIYIPIKSKALNKEDIEKMLISNPWKYQRFGGESRYDFFNERLNTFSIRKLGYWHFLNGGKMFVDNIPWILHNYKGCILLSISTTPACSELFEIIHVSENTIKTKVYFKSWFESRDIINFENDKDFENKFYEKINEIELQRIEPLSHKQKKDLSKKLQDGKFKILDFEKKGKGASRHLEVIATFLEMDCLKNKEINIRINNDTLFVKDCMDSNYSFPLLYTCDGDFLVPKDIKTEYYDIYNVKQINKELYIDFIIKIKTGKRFFDSYIVSTKLEKE